MAEEIVEKKTVKKTATKKTTKAVKAKAQEFLGTGRRKCSVARVRLTTGAGEIKINDKSLDEYFDLETLKTMVKQPLVLTETLNSCATPVALCVPAGRLSSGSIPSASFPGQM